MQGQTIDWSRILRGEGAVEKYPRWLRVVILFGGIVLSWSVLFKIAASLI